jgi:uncharacterized protein YcgI (DUF1989 family)
MGRRADIVQSPSTGMTRRVFKGQRWLVVAQMDEQSPCDLLAFETREKAQRVSERCRKLGCEVHYVEPAVVLREQVTA